METIGVVIPVYNEEDSIGPCLEAVFAQKRPFDEVIVVDNGCTDTTMRIVERYLSEHGQLRTMAESRKGLVHARAAGLDAAKSDIVGRIDADSRIGDGWSTAALAALSSGEWAAASGITLFYDAPFQPQMRRAFMWTMRIQGKERGGASPGVQGENMAIRSDAWRKISAEASDRADIHEDQLISIALRSHDLGIYFSPEMEVAQSPRRALISPIGNARYFATNIRTAWVRREWLGVLGAALSLPFNVMWFTALWLVFRLYDPSTGRWDLRRLTQPIDERESPLA